MGVGNGYFLWRFLFGCPSGRAVKGPTFFTYVTMPLEMKMTPEDQAEIFDYLESLNPTHLKEGIVTIMLAYFQDNVEDGMHTCLDKKFYTDIETLLIVLSIREKYTFE